jgi:hypothetical protein
MITKTSENQLTILNKLVELEESVGRLYNAYADFFSDYRWFWSDLANEEGQHAEWLHKLHDCVTHDPDAFTENRFNVVVIQTVINYLSDEYNKVMNRERVVINAFSITVYIEKSMIEREYFQVFPGDSPELKQTLDNLTIATKNHISRVCDVFNDYKRAILQDSNKEAFVF